MHYRLALGEALLSMFLKKEHITQVMNAAMDHVDENRLVLADGTAIDFAYAMIVPRLSART
jgi:hypothetical protein